MTNRSGKAERDRREARDRDGRDQRVPCLNLTFTPVGVAMGRSVTGPTGARLSKSRHSTRSPGYAPTTKQDTGIKQQSPKSSLNEVTIKNGRPRPQTAHQYYQRKLHNDIDKLLLEDIEVIEEKSNVSSRCKSARQRRPHRDRHDDNILAEDLLNKVEQQNQYMRIAQRLFHNSQTVLTSRASTSVAPQSFLIDDISNRPVTDFDSKLGRPTRTTLLRNRQRSNSAPFTSYDTREEIKKRNQFLLDQRINTRPNTANSLDPVISEDMDGESMHGFLTGARYNRAHYVDAKSLMKYGVYMPRGNPSGCFINENKLYKTCTTSSTDDSIGSIPPVPAATPENPPDSDRDESVPSGHFREPEVDLFTPAPPCTPAPPLLIVHSDSRLQDLSSSLTSSRSPTSSKSPSSHHAWADMTTSGSLADIESGPSDSTCTILNADKLSAASGIDRLSGINRFSTGPDLNITGKKLQFAGTVGLTRDRPRPPLPFPSLICNPIYETPPPPPSVDMSAYQLNPRLDLAGFPLGRPVLKSAGSDVTRTVRFSESCDVVGDVEVRSPSPQNFGIVGRGMASPTSSPKHKSILKSDDTIAGESLRTDNVPTDDAPADNEPADNAPTENILAETAPETTAETAPESLENTTTKSERVMFFMTEKQENEDGIVLLNDHVTDMDDDEKKQEVEEVPTAAISQSKADDDAAIAQNKADDEDENLGVDDVTERVNNEPDDEENVGTEVVEEEKPDTTETNEEKETPDTTETNVEKERPDTTETNEDIEHNIVNDNKDNDVDLDVQGLETKGEIENLANDSIVDVVGQQWMEASGVTVFEHETERGGIESDSESEDEGEQRVDTLTSHVTSVEFSSRKTDSAPD